MSPSIEQAEEFVEKLRLTTIGDPVWKSEKSVYEYSEESARVVVVLKLVRAVHALNAMAALIEQGLFTDCIVINRCINDCVSEVHFLIEKYPEMSVQVTKFVEHFFAQKIDSDLKKLAPNVDTKKIKSAEVRSINKGSHNSELTEMVTKIHKTMSEYTHAGYSSIMEMYGGGPQASFNLKGIPCSQQRAIRRRFLTEACKAVLLATGFAAFKLGKMDLHNEIKAYC